MAKATSKRKAPNLTNTPRAAMSAAKKQPANDPASAPKRYIVMLAGACMQPVMKDGAAVMVDRDARPKAGDLVVIYFKPEHVRPGQSNSSLKRLVTNIPDYVKWPWTEHPKSDVHAMVVFEMLNPPEQFQCKAQDLLAIHKVIGQVPADVKFDAERNCFTFPKDHPGLSA